MVYYNSILTGSVNIPIFNTDPISSTLISPGLIWYNSTIGALRYTYNVTGSDSLYCIKTMNSIL
jgi:hypothetical protein